MFWWGAVRAVTDETGLARERTTFRPYGEEMAALTPLTLPETKGYIGERYDDASGLQYLNARYYDPRLAMFIQPDWWEVTREGVGTNRYAYSFGDPVNGKDPTGHDIFRPGGTAALEALQDPAERDEIYRRNAETHAEIARQFTEEERDLEDIQYHLDAAAYYEGRVGISTSELLAEATTGAAYLALGARTLPQATAPTTQTVATTRYQTLSELNAAETRAIIESQPHKNSLAYVGDTHVYAIRDANGNIYKIGESAQGTRLTDGASIRAEQQVRQLTRSKGGFFESEIRKTFGSKAEARAYETHLIERFRSMFGNEQLPGNLTNR